MAWGGSLMLSKAQKSATTPSHDLQRHNGDLLVNEYPKVSDFC